MTAPSRLRARCAVHPARPAMDACPVCERPRCAADAAAPGPGCLACTAQDLPLERVASDPTAVERLVRATLAAYAVALVGGLVASEYVGATVFGYLGPFVLGVVCGAAALRAAPSDGRGREGSRIRAAAALLAVLGTAWGFVVEGSLDVLSPSPKVLVPYVAAAAGALLWTMPPRRRGTGQGLSTDV